jgi:hypothetical protein
MPAVIRVLDQSLFLRASMAEVAVSRTVEFEIVSPDRCSLELVAKTGSRIQSAFGGLLAVNRL